MISPGKEVNKIRVIHSYPVWLPQTQTWMYNQVKYLPEEIEAHIVCERTENLDQFGLPNIHALENASQLRRQWDWRLRMHGFRQHLGFLTAWAKKVKADIVHSHFGNIGWKDMDAVKRTGARHVVTFYGQDVNYLPTIDPSWRVRYRDLFAHVDQVLCEGPHMARCVTNLGCPQEKVRVQHLGVRLDQIPFKPRSWNPSTPLRILIAASFQEKKGIPHALEALGKFREEIPLEITIIGDAGPQRRSQVEKEKILNLIQQLNLAKDIRMLGYQPHAVLLEEAYRHHIFLSPSIMASDGDTEGGAPVSIIEMSASGMPIVSTNHCDIPEVLSSLDPDWLVPEGDVNGLVERLRWLTSNPEMWLESLTAERYYLDHEFDAKDQGINLASIYTNCVSRN